MYINVKREKAKTPCSPKQHEYTSDFDDNILPAQTEGRALFHMRKNYNKSWN
jgi:hypothetical protein